MGVYEDMANDAGCAYGTDDNRHMAAMIEEQEYNKDMESRYHEEMEQQYYYECEQDYWETVREERRLKILFRKFSWKKA